MKEVVRNNISLDRTSITYQSYQEYKISKGNWLKEIPQHWEYTSLKFISKIIKGYSFKTKNMRENGIPLVRIGDLSEELNEERRYLPESYEVKYPEYLIQKGDILLALSGATVGKTYVYREDSKALLNQRVAAIRSKACSQDFLGYFIESDYFNKKVKISCLGSAQENINDRELKELPVVLPPLNEQKTIVNFLDRETSKIDHLIEKQEKLIDLLEEKRIALISNTVAKGLDETVEMKDSGVEWFKTIPSHWETRKLKQVARIISSNVDKKTKEREKQVRLCNYSEVYNNAEITNDLDFMGASARDQQIKKLGLQKDDVVVTKDSESWDDIAVPAYIGEEIKDLVCGYHLSIIRPQPKDLLGKYLYFLLAAKGISDQFHVKANGVTRFGLSIHDLQTSLIPIPPRKEQTEIVNYLNAQTEIINRANGNIRRSMGKLKEYRTALISAAVTGKIDVRGEV